MFNFYYTLRYNKTQDLQCLEIRAMNTPKICMTVTLRFIHLSKSHPPNFPNQPQQPSSGVVGNLTNTFDRTLPRQWMYWKHRTEWKFMDLQQNIVHNEFSSSNIICSNNISSPQRVRLKYSNYSCNCTVNAHTWLGSHSLRQGQTHYQLLQLCNQLLQLCNHAPRAPHTSVIILPLT